MAYIGPPAPVSPPVPPGSPERAGAGAIAAVILAGLWLAGLAIVTQYGAWLANQILLNFGLILPTLTWVIIAVAVLLLGGPPALLVALIPRSPAVRATGRALTIGVGALAVGCVLRTMPFRLHDVYLLLLAVTAGVAAALLRRQSSGLTVPGALGWAVAAGAVMLAPFAWFGALGGVLETILAVLAALAVGALAATMLDAGFWEPFRTGGKARLVLLGGLAAGTALVPLGSAVGADGVQLLSLVVLPPLGFAAAALAPAASRGSVMTFLFGLAALGPLGFVDPDEITIFLTGRDVPFWAAAAAILAWLLAIGIGLGYGLGLLRATRSPLPNQVRHIVGTTVAPRFGSRALGAGVAAVAVAGAGLLYGIAGQPGFHGDLLFVVFKDQASLAGLPSTTGVGPGRDERVAAVYERLVRHADETQRELREDLSRWRLPYRPYYLVNALLVHGGPGVRAWLASRPEVDRVLLDQKLRPLPAAAPVSRGPINVAPGTPPWNLDMVGAPQAWASGVTGEGIVVGGSDSGVDGSHPALAGNYRGGDDSWFDPWNGSRTPVDHNGHGTHTLATAVGSQLVGVAPDAQWIGCVNLDRNMASPSYYLDCMQFMLAPYPLGGDAFRDGRPERAPHVLTNSWGCPPLEGCDLTVLRPAGDAVAAAGIAFVAAAGNSGPRCESIDTPPGSDPTSITVGAVDEQRRVPFFSSRGGDGKPDITAPGADVLSAMPGGTYAALDGTSMATPHVAGVIALLWSAHPELVGDLATTRDLLAATAEPAIPDDSSCAPSQQTGAGIVNAARALDVAGR